MVGTVVKFEIESPKRPENQDHVFVSLDAGVSAPVILSLNTLSFRNRVAGHDARIRVGILRGVWNQLPRRGLYPLEFFDYETVDLLGHVEYRVLERTDVEDFFAQHCATCRLVEAWGLPYHRSQPGLHQIHSRRASCGVPTDLRGRDGAVRFYFDAGRASELVLLKFCGQ